MQFSGQGKPAAGIIFDTGMSRIADALTLAMLYGFEGKSEARLVAVSVSRPNLDAATFCEAMGHFYARPTISAGGFARILPVGLSLRGKPSQDSLPWAAPLGRRDAEGKPVYVHNIHKLNDTADPLALIRNALTAQVDQNAIVIMSGPATNLAALLKLRDGRDLIRQKVRYLVAAVGRYPEGPPDPSLQADMAAAQTLFGEWPGDIVACGSEVGGALLFPASSIEKDFAWAPAHPVADAYRANRSMPYDAPSEPMAAALYAVRPKDDAFRLSEPGTISITSDGRARFTSSTEGKRRYLILNPEQKDRIIKTYSEIASAKPVVRARPRPPQ